MVNTKSLTCDLPDGGGKAGRPGSTVWRGDSPESLAGVRRKWAHPIGFTPKVILTLVNLQEFMFENPSGDMRRDRGGTQVWKTIQLRRRRCFTWTHVKMHPVKPQKRKLVWNFRLRVLTPFRCSTGMSPFWDRCRLSLSYLRTIESLAAVFRSNWWRKTCFFHQENPPHSISAVMEKVISDITAAVFQPIALAVLND